MALDFPSSPTSGQIYDRYKWDSTDTVWSLNLPEYNLVPLGYLPSIQYVVISGGAGGGANIGGGGGAGFKAFQIAMVVLSVTRPTIRKTKKIAPNFTNIRPPYVISVSVAPCFLAIVLVYQIIDINIYPFV